VSVGCPIAVAFYSFRAADGSRSSGSCLTYCAATQPRRRGCVIRVNCWLDYSKKMSDPSRSLCVHLSVAERRHRLERLHSNVAPTVHASVSSRAATPLRETPLYLALLCMVLTKAGTCLLTSRGRDFGSKLPERLRCIWEGITAKRHLVSQKKLYNPTRSNTMKISVFCTNFENVEIYRQILWGPHNNVVR
jgi:hypothetical protein